MKDSRKAISADPEMKIFKIFTSVSIMVASQGDTKPNNLPGSLKNILDTAM